MPRKINWIPRLLGDSAGAWLEISIGMLVEKINKNEISWVGGFISSDEVGAERDEKGQSPGRLTMQDKIPTGL